MMNFFKNKNAKKEMLQEILKTVKSYRLVNYEVLSNEEVDSLDRQIQFLQEQIK